MNDLGMTLAWLAVQVTASRLAGLALHALASRRGPAAGAWVAALSLGLVVVLSAAALIPVNGRGQCRLAEAGARPMSPRASGATPVRHRTRSVAATPPIARARSPGRLGDGGSAARLGPARARGGRAGGAVPAVGERPGGRRAGRDGRRPAPAGDRALGGRVCRRRGRVGRRPGMSGLLDELRGAMGCRPPVELREVPDLTTPATAGWRRPVILLPDDWRSWDDSERRAVLAHELAHIVRGDYAAGLLARLAVALNYYHPVVRWMAGRLQLQQELAADAMGARFAGGRASYLVALSRLALEQDGRSPCWPARAFLPGRGTLIRRIAMLRDRRKPDLSTGRCPGAATPHDRNPPGPDGRRGDAPRPGPRRRRR